MEQNARLVYKTNSSNLLSKNTNDVPEMQSVKKKIDVSVWLEVTLSLQLRQAQLDNLLGNGDQEALRRQTARVVHEQHQFVAEREAQIYVVRHSMGIGATNICVDSRISLTGT